MLKMAQDHMPGRRGIIKTLFTIGAGAVLAPSLVKGNSYDITGTMYGTIADCYTGDLLPNATITFQCGSNVVSGKTDHGGVYNVPFDFNTAVKDRDQNSVPNNYQLFQNYPNPFGDASAVAYAVMKRGDVNIIIYNTLGQKVKTLENKMQQPGVHQVVWDGKTDGGVSVAPGMYIAALIADGKMIDKKKMTFTPGNGHYFGGTHPVTQSESLKKVVDEGTKINKTLEDNVMKVDITHPDYFNRLTWFRFESGMNEHHENLLGSGHIAYIDDDPSKPEVTGDVIMQTLYGTNRVRTGSAPYGPGLSLWKQPPIFYINPEGFTPEHGFPDNAVELLKDDILYVVNNLTPFDLRKDDIQVGTENLLIPRNDGSGAVRTKPGYAFSKFRSDIMSNAWSAIFSNSDNRYVIDGTVTDHGTIYPTQYATKEAVFKWRNRHEALRMIGYSGGPPTIFNGYSLLAQTNPEMKDTKLDLSKLEIIASSFMFSENRHIGNQEFDNEVRDLMPL